MTTFTWKCPKCGNLNRVDVATHTSFYTPLAIYCCQEGGGCDEMFAIQARPVTTWEVKVFELVEMKE